MSLTGLLGRKKPPSKTACCLVAGAGHVDATEKFSTKDSRCSFGVFPVKKKTKVKSAIAAPSAFPANFALLSSAFLIRFFAIVVKFN